MAKWQHRAACRNVDPELFFPLNEDPNGGPILAAKAVCAGCPVTDECLRFALTHGLDDGVFGGLTADERRALRDRAMRERAVTRAVERRLPKPPGHQIVTRGPGGQFASP